MHHSARFLHVRAPGGARRPRRSWWKPGNGGAKSTGAASTGLPAPPTAGSIGARTVSKNEAPSGPR
eukprot:1226768-Alexandrium_andersonii.AAC.1